jgi:solute carrier family 25 phosphate transporter 3
VEKYQDFIYLAGSASAEFIADVALCPFEAVKARARRRAAAAGEPKPPVAV